MKKLMIAFAALALSAAGAQKFSVRLFQPSRLAGTDLAAGDYRLELNDEKVTLKNGKHAVEATAKVQNGDKKFRATTMKITQGEIEEICLGGTNPTLVFNR